jgi:uncharacterized protein (DUF2249 family)
MANDLPSNDSAVIDVRKLAPLIRHSFIFQTFEQLQPGASFLLVNDHDPMPLYYQFSSKWPDEFTWEYLEQGPEEWRVRICKV